MQSIRGIEVSQTPPAADKLWIRPNGDKQDVFILRNGKWKNISDSSAMLISVEAKHKNETGVENSISKEFEDTSNILIADSLYEGCDIKQLDIPVETFNHVITATNMFKSCLNLKRVYVSNTCFRNARSINGMFASCSNLETFEAQKDAFSLSPALFNMFRDCPKLTSVKFIQGYTNGVEQCVMTVTNANGMFYGDSSLQDVVMNPLPFLCSAYAMFGNCSSLSEFKPTELPSLTNGAYMFYNCSSLSEFKPTELPSLTNGAYMFYNCSSLSELNLALPKCIDLKSAFECKSTVSPKMRSISIAEISSNIEDISWIVSRQINLETFTYPSGGFSNVRYAYSAFSNATKLKSIETSGSDFSNLIIAAYLFYNATSIESLTFPEGTPKIELAESMFKNCTSLKSIIGLDLSGLCLGDAYCSQDVKEWLSSQGFTYAPSDYNVDDIFKNCTNLVDCELQGTLYKSGIDLRPCTKLSEQSLKSFVNAFYDWNSNTEGKQTDDTTHSLLMTTAQQATVGEELINEAVLKGWTIKA